MVRLGVAEQHHDSEALSGITFLHGTLAPHSCACRNACLCLYGAW